MPGTRQTANVDGCDVMDLRVKFTSTIFLGELNLKLYPKIHTYIHR